MTILYDWLLLCTENCLRFAPRSFLPQHWPKTQRPAKSWPPSKWFLGLRLLPWRFNCPNMRRSLLRGMPWCRRLQTFPGESWEWKMQHLYHFISKLPDLIVPRCFRHDPKITCYRIRTNCIQLLFLRRNLDWMYSKERSARSNKST